jgi:hypothetical protein
MRIFAIKTQKYLIKVNCAFHQRMGLYARGHIPLPTFH